MNYMELAAFGRWARGLGNSEWEAIEDFLSTSSKVQARSKEDSSEVLSSGSVTTATIFKHGRGTKWHIVKTKGAGLSGCGAYSTHSSGAKQVKEVPVSEVVRLNQSNWSVCVNCWYTDWRERNQ